MPQSAADTPLVGIIMGSQSDWDTMRHAADVLAELGVPHETRIVSAHRTPDRLYDYAKAARGRGLKAIIAGAGGAAHLLAAAVIALMDDDVAAALDDFRAKQTASVADVPMDDPKGS